MNTDNKQDHVRIQRLLRVVADLQEQLELNDRSYKNLEQTRQNDITKLNNRVLHLETQLDLERNAAWNQKQELDCKIEDLELDLDDMQSALHNQQQDYRQLETKSNKMKTRLANIHKNMLSVKRTLRNKSK
jgi:hypothetical protein